MRFASYWSTLGPVPGLKEPEELPGNCEVAVIGGGLTGLSTALHLREYGHEVVVLEKETIGWGASTRNAGMALTGLKPIPEALFRSFGADTARRLYRTSLEAIDFAAALIQKLGIDCDFSRCGALWVASKPSHFRSFQASQRFMKNQLDHETHLVPAAALPAELASSAYFGALIDPLSASLNPAKLVAGIAHAAQQAGAMLFTQAAVTQLRQEKTGYTLTTTRGTIHADAIVAATNGYTDDLLPYFRRRILPIGSYIVVTEPLPAELATGLIPNNRMVFDTLNFLHYFRRTPDNRLLFGGRNSFVPITDARSAGLLRREMIRVFPVLTTVELDFAWHGNVGYPFDHLPHIGNHEGIYYALGYCGHGVVMSVYFGYYLARAIHGEPCDLPFWGRAFPAKFFYRKNPWFLPLAGFYYKIRDWFA